MFTNEVENNYILIARVAIGDKWEVEMGKRDEQGRPILVHF